MGLIDYEKLPVIKSFKDLKQDDKVYSHKYGLGSIVRFYHNQIVFEFGNYRKRLSEGEEDLREIPNNWFLRIKTRPMIKVSGQEMSLAAFRRERKRERRRNRLLRNLLNH